MSETTVTFVNELVQRFPELDKLLKEHNEDNGGETLPHIFFWDVTQHVVLLATQNRRDLLARKQLTDILNFMERAYEHGNEEIQELISVSFLENLPRPGEPGSEIRNSLGPHLTRQLVEIG